MKKYFIVSDVHGFYNELMQALKEKGYDENNTDHVFVSLGDLCDRGPDNKKCLEFVNSIPNSNKILILGNHEDLMKDAIQRGRFFSHDYMNRTTDTAEELTGIDYWKNFGSPCLESMKKNVLWNTYVESCIDYFEIDNYILVHAWVPFYEDMQESQNLYPLNYWGLKDWTDARWKNPFECWQNGRGIKGKTIVCGHWSTSFAHEKFHNIKNCHDVFQESGIIALDATTVISNKINCYIIEN